MRLYALALVVGLGILAATPSPCAAQEPLFEALGQAPIVAGDRVRARDRALDEALRQAVEQATATVLEPAELVGRASDLKLRIYPKAKSYIANYRILDEGEQSPGTFQVHLSASVATGRLARDLSTGSATSAAGPARKQRAVVCASVTGDGTEASVAADKALRELVEARRVDPMPGPQPCDPAGAASVLRSGTAQAALTAEVQVSPAGEIRGTTLAAASARAQVKMVEPDGRVSASGEAERGGYASGPDAASTAAARAAVVEAARGIEVALAQRWPGESSASGGVAVRVTGLQRWVEYQAVMRALGALPGVAAVEPRRFVRGEVDLVVRTASAAAQLAAHLQRVPPPGVRVGVRAAGETVEIEITGDATERG
jgi:flagellar assembly FlgT-like protein